MSLVDNLKAAQTGDASASGADPQQGQTVDQVMNTGLPGHEAKAEAAPEQAQAEAQAEVPKETFKVGTETFASIEDVMNHAQRLDREKIERDAYDLGKQDAQPVSAEAQVDADAEFRKQMADLLFENPAEAIKQIEDRAVSKATSTIKEETASQRTKEKTWSGFYDSNKDLTEHKDLVDFILEKNWDTLGSMQGDKALQKLADLTRERMQSVVKSLRPEEVLPSGSAQVTATSNEALAQKAPERQKLDFSQQVRMLNKSRKQFKELSDD